MHSPQSSIPRSLSGLQNKHETVLIPTLGLMALYACIASAQNNPVPANAVFALVPAATASGLAARNDSPEARKIVKRATDDLTATPHPLATIHTQGTLPHQGIYDESKAAEADFPIILDLALGYRLTGDARYLNAANAYLVAWASIYNISLDPIDETNLDKIIIAYDLTRDALPDSTRQKMTLFLRHMAEGYAGAVVQKKKDAGNWQSHRIKLLTLSAFAVGDQALIHKAHEAFTEHLKANIRPDGSVYDFYERDALHYVTYDLEPLTVACLAAMMHGQDWFSEGAPHSVAKAIDWLLPFATGQKTHVEFVGSKVKFDKARAGAGNAEYGAHQWQPAGCVNLLTLAAALDPARREVCRQVATAAGKGLSDWVVLLFWPKN